jgi:hypothetical protein
MARYQHLQLGKRVWLQQGFREGGIMYAVGRAGVEAVQQRTGPHCFLVRVLVSCSVLGQMSNAWQGPNEEDMMHMGGVQAHTTGF